MNQDGLKLNGTYQLLFYDDGINISGGRLYYSLVVVIKEFGLELNADKTMYMVMFRDQKAGRSTKIKTGNSSFERVEEF